MRSKHLKALLGTKIARKLEALEKLQGLRSHGGIRRTLKALIDAEYRAVTENFGQTHLVYPKTNPLQRTNPTAAFLLDMLKRGDEIIKERGLRTFTTPLEMGQLPQARDVI